MVKEKESHIVRHLYIYTHTYTHKHASLDRLDQIDDSRPCCPGCESMNIWLEINPEGLPMIFCMDCEHLFKEPQWNNES